MQCRQKWNVARLASKVTPFLLLSPGSAHTGRQTPQRNDEYRQTWTKNHISRDKEPSLTLRLRLLSSWNGKMQFCCRSHATASLSITADVTESFKPASIVCIRRTMSGYLAVLSSWLRLNTLTLPSSSTWIYNYMYALRMSNPKWKMPSTLVTVSYEWERGVKTDGSQV